MNLLIQALVLLAPLTADGFLLHSISARRQASAIPSLYSSPLEDLEIVDTQEGTGDVAKFESIVTIKYVGKFYDDESSQQEPFDESMISFKLGCGKVIKGCDKGVRGMKVGGTRVLKIPANLGFGAEGFTGPYSIPPNTDLEYSVELTAVASGPMAEAAANMGIGLDRNTVYLK
jgi:FKBP-type peptidyl-prolyl cis-trans isomerase FkpA